MLKKRENKLLFSSILIILAVLLFVSKFNKNNKVIKQERSGDLISVTVDSPFLFSLISDLTLGSNTTLNMGDSNVCDYKYTLYNDDGEPTFKDIKKDVVLFGENSLHDLDINDYDSPRIKTPTLPDEYKDREDIIPIKNYFLNPINGKRMLDSIYSDLSKHSPVILDNYNRMTDEMDDVFLQASKLGEDYENPVMFYAGNIYSIGWVQDLNKNIKIVSLKDSKTRRVSETYDIFLTACKKYGVKKILTDKDSEVVNALKRDIEDLNVIYLHEKDIYTNLSEFYKTNLNLIEDSLLKLY